MTDDIREKIEEFREVHRGDVGARVLADQLMELGVFDISNDERQMHLKNHAVQVIANMGVITQGDKYQLLLELARVLQKFVPDRQEENDGRE